MLISGPTVVQIANATGIGYRHDRNTVFLFGNGGGALAIGKNYARNAQIGKKSRRKIL